MRYRDYRYLGTTQSLCPATLELVAAKIIARGNRVYFRKSCPGGIREDFVCSDSDWFDLTEFSLPGKMPDAYGVRPRAGCPFDCGLCEEHEQHTCVGLLEITSSCNLECPMCFASSGPAGNHLTFQECQIAIDRLVTVERQPEVLQLSGGEPTIHPDFAAVLEYACQQPIDVVMINTNGIRISRDAELVDLLVRWRHRLEVYLQFDGLADTGMRQLRGESLLETKLRAIEVLGQAGIRTTLVCTAQSDVNDDQYGPLVDFGTARPWITGISFQPATYVGRHFLPEDLERRITFPDILKGIVRQSTRDWRTSDFSPLPCAHPNGHSLAYAYRERTTSPTEGGLERPGDMVLLPLARFIDIPNHIDLLSGRITFQRERARQLIEEYLSREACSHGGCQATDSWRTPTRPAFDDGSARQPLTATQQKMVMRFLERAAKMDLDPEDVFRITTTSFMDAYNFDIRQLIKSCVHHVLPTGHIVPFSAYNILYREGHVELPPLRRPQGIPLEFHS